MYRIQPVLRDYAWGSHEALARLTGRPHPSAEPEAEMWLGAHESAPAPVIAMDGSTDSSLADLIAADPQRHLGREVYEAFGRLPFLLKVLAPDKALSIQAHPNEQQVASAPEGVYLDRWPKPEALCALGAYEMFAGLRSFDQIGRIVQDFGAVHLGARLDNAAEQDDPVGALLASLLRADAGSREQLVAEVLRGARVHSELPWCDALIRVSEQFPGDIGLVVLALMEHVVLQADEYVFVPAGVLHTSVHGVTVELQASSDNVIRAGLTPKKIDIEELLRIVDTAGRMQPQQPQTNQRVTDYASPVPYFRLERIEPGTEPVTIQAAGPRILLNLGGRSTLECDASTIELDPGEAVFVSADEGDLRIRGTGTGYLAAVGDLDRRVS